MACARPAPTSTAGRFVDYTELDAASNRRRGRSAGLLEQAVYKPVQGRFKVFMIDEVHMLTNTAFNAMLKTLEEPPEYLKFVLATTDPQKVPVTVLIALPAVQPAAHGARDRGVEHLQQVLQAESVLPPTSQALRLLARAARGSMRDALSLTDQAIAFGGGQLARSHGAPDAGCGGPQPTCFGLIDALARADGGRGGRHRRTARERLERRLHAGRNDRAVLQRMAVLQAVPGSRSGGMPMDDPDEARGGTARWQRLMPPDETQLLYSLCLHGRGELGLAPDEYAALTMVLLRLLAFKPKHGRLTSGPSAIPEKKSTENG